MDRLTRWTALFAIGVLSIASCVADENGAMPPGGMDNSKDPKAANKKDTSPAPAPATTMDVGLPLINPPLPSTTYWSAIPVKGKGPAGGKLLVHSPASGN